MKYKDYMTRRGEAEDARLDAQRSELEAAHAAELGALIEEIYNEDMEVINYV